MTNDDYLKEFQAEVSTLDFLGANILGNITSFLEDEVKSMFSINMEDTTVDQII